MYGESFKLWRYDEEPGLTKINEDIVNGTDMVGWLNQILGTQHSMAHRFPLWDTVEKYVLENMEYYDEPLTYDNLMDIIPRRSRLAAGETDLTDLLYIIEGTETLKEEETYNGTYPYDVLKCRMAIREFIDKTNSENSLPQLWELACSDRCARQKMSGEEIGAFS